jgi:hypothetical protein
VYQHRPQREYYRQSGNGLRNNTPPHWQTSTGANKEQALAQLATDYDAQHKAINEQFMEIGPPQPIGQDDEPDQDGMGFTHGLATLCEAAGLEDGVDGSWCGMMVAHHPSADDSHTDVLPWHSFPAGAPPAKLTGAHVKDEAALALLSNTTSPDPTVDSGTTDHIFRRESDFTNMVQTRVPITVAGGQIMWALGRGEVHVQLPSKSGKPVPLVLKHALFVPSACRDLVSTTRLEEDGHGVLFQREHSALIFDNGVRIPLLRDGRLRTLPLHRAPSIQSYLSQLRRVMTPHPTRIQPSKRPTTQPSLRKSAPAKRVRFAADRTNNRPSTMMTIVSVLLAHAFESITHPTCSTTHLATLTDADMQHLMHRRAAHFSHGVLRKTHQLDIARGFDYRHRHPVFCDACPAGNSRYPSTTTKRTRASQPLELVHCDLWGKAQCRSLHGNRYAMCFVDDYSRYIKLYFLPSKDKAADALRAFIDEHAAPLKLNLHAIQSDGGGEFLGAFRDICKTNGIRQQFSAPDFQSQNSVAERTWRTIFSAVVRMLEDCHLPCEYWEDAAGTAAHVKN